MIITILALIGGFALYYLVGFLALKWLKWLESWNSFENDFFLPILAPLFVFLAILSTILHIINFPSRIRDIEERLDKLEKKRRN